MGGDNRLVGFSFPFKKAPLLCVVLAVHVDEDADVDTDDGKDDAEQRDGRQLADEGHANVHHDAHQDEQHGAVRAEVVVHDLLVVAEVAVQRQLGRQVVLENKHYRERVNKCSIQC